MTEKAPRKQRLAGVVGWPVSHSLSPLIHSTWAAREGADARYAAIPVEPDDRSFRIRIDELRRSGYRGVNVTIPHKERALRYATTASEDARAAGAANMLTFSEGGVHAENSDIIGLAAALEKLSPRRDALILGAGGAARAVAIALKRRLCAERILIANRTRARAEEVAALVGAAAISWEERSAAAASADIVVNATSLGMTGEAPLDIDIGGMGKDAVVCDIVYSPLETRLLKAARMMGLRAVDGLEMLMRQAVPGYLAWLGDRAEVDADLRARLEAALKARSVDAFGVGGRR